MATKQKKTTKAKETAKTLSKAKSPTKGQKASPKASNQKMKAHLIPKNEVPPVLTAADPNAYIDPAHRIGHQTINLKKQFGGPTGNKVYAQDSSAMNRMTAEAKIARTESSQRRIISGASLGKKGRLNNDDRD